MSASKRDAAHAIAITTTTTSPPAHDNNNKSSDRRVSTTESSNSRESWGNGIEFLLSCIGLSVGLGNVWRFPYLCYKNGGGAFLIPYLIMLTIAGRPMYFMELCLGQFASLGPLTIWHLSPIMKGVGAAMVLGSIVVCIYYNVVMSYALYYMYSSFSSTLPWTTCDDVWAKGTNCIIRSANTTQVSSNGTVFINGTSSSQIFWERKVLDISSGIEEIGGIKWDLAFALAISWIIVISCLVKGVKTSGKVIYFAATFPYIILLILLIVGVTQEGAWNGIVHLFKPDFDKLFQISVWQDAASQMFFSLGVAMGGLVMYSSYNDFRHNIFRDAVIVSILDTATSIISGIVIFSILGALSHELKIDISAVVEKGPGLAFVAYPEALSRLPLPQLWSVLFFFMFYMLGLDSEFAILENIVTSLCDEIPSLRRHRLKLTVSLGVTFFFCGLMCVTRGGMYIFNLLDYYGGTIPLTFLAVFECIGLMWVYGFKKFTFDVSFMLNRQMGLYWHLTWKYTAPVVLAFIIIASLYNHRPLTYTTYDYPEWADIFGWILTCSIIFQIPLWAFYAVKNQKKGLSLIDRVKLACEDTDDWGPRNEVTRSEWRSAKTNLLTSTIVTGRLSSTTSSVTMDSSSATLKKVTKVNGVNDVISGSVNEAFESEKV